jgi:hypothetical protein
MKPLRRCLLPGVLSRLPADALAQQDGIRENARSRAAMRGRNRCRYPTITDSAAPERRLSIAAAVVTNAKPQGSFTEQA